MFDFFSNNVKRKAFKVALKEIESQGFYVDLATEKESVAVLPELSRAVASLSGSTKHREKVKPTLDLKTVEQDVDSSVAKQQIKKEEPISVGQRSQFYQNLFSGNSAFLDSNQDYDNIETLDNLSEESKAVQDSINKAKFKHDSNKDIFAALNKKAVQEEAENNKAKEQETLNIQIIKAHTQEPELEEEKKPEKPRKLVVEVVADKEQKPKPKPRKKSKTTRKRKRKYDADIVGGFGF